MPINPARGRQLPLSSWSGRNTKNPASAIIAHAAIIEIACQRIRPICAEIVEFPHFVNRNGAEPPAVVGVEKSAAELTVRVAAGHAGGFSSLEPISIARSALSKPLIASMRGAFR